MKTLAAILLAGALLIPFGACATWVEGQPGYSQRYDPARRPLDDLLAARMKAASERKKILLLVGGEWCNWCQTMERFLNAQASLARSLTETFVVVKVNVSDENRNEAFLRHYPAYEGVPHFYVLDQQGNLLESINTGLLEQGESYNLETFRQLIDHVATR